MKNKLKYSAKKMVLTILITSFFSQIIAMERVDYAQTEQRPLFIELRKNDFEKVKELIAGGKVSLNEMNCALFFAAETNRVEQASLLISKGADVNVVSKYGRTPLHVAATKNSKEVAELLIKNGANIDAVDDNDWTPLHRAVCENGREVAELLIKNGADIDAIDNDGWTPLHWAVAVSGENMVKYLLFEGVSYKKKDKYQQTAYGLAKNDSIKKILKDEKSVEEAIQSVREEVKRKICATKCSRTNIFTSVMNQQITGSFKPERKLLSGEK